MEFLVEFDVTIPDGTSESEIGDRQRAEASAAAKLVAEGHLVRLWNRTVVGGKNTILGLYRAASDVELDDLLRALPLYDWMQVVVTPLGAHPNDPAAASASRPA